MVLKKFGHKMGKVLYTDANYRNKIKVFNIKLCGDGNVNDGKRLHESLFFILKVLVFQEGFYTVTDLKALVVENTHVVILLLNWILLS